MGGVLVLILVLVALAVLAWMLFLPAAARRTVTDRSGFPTTLDRLSANPFTGTFQGGGLHVDNPAELGGGAFVRIAEFSGQVAPLSATQDEFVIETLTVDLTQLVIVVDAAGKTNAEAFGARLAWAEPPTARSLAAAPRHAVAGFPGLGEGPRSVVIHRLRLKIGRVDLVPGPDSNLQRLGDQLDFEAEYTDVRRIEDLLSAELLGRLARSPALWQALLSSGALGDDAAGLGPLQKLWHQAGDALNSLFRKLEQTGKP